MPAMCPTMCAFGGDDLEDALRDERAAAPRRRRARAAAELRRHLLDAGRRPRAARAGVRRMTTALTADRPPPMTFDTTAFVRLDSLQILDRSASGASLATSTGDILEVSCYGPGVFRMRVGPTTQPDYGLVVGRSKPCTVEQGESGTWKFTAGESTLEITSTPLRFRLLHRGAPVAGSITDEHFRGLTQAARVRPHAPGLAVDRVARARVRRARLRSRREVRPAQQARTARPFARRRCARRQHRASRTRTCRSRGAPAPARGHGASSSTRRHRSRTASAIPIGRTGPT